MYGRDRVSSKKKTKKKEKAAFDYCMFFCLERDHVCIAVAFPLLISKD